MAGILKMANNFQHVPCSKVPHLLACAARLKGSNIGAFHVPSCGSASQARRTVSASFVFVC